MGGKLSKLAPARAPSGYRHNQPGAGCVGGLLLGFGFFGGLPGGNQGFLGGHPLISGFEHRNYVRIR
jgi:hypothetical protein